MKLGRGGWRWIGVVRGEWSWVKVGVRFKFNKRLDSLMINHASHVLVPFDKTNGLLQEFDFVRF